MRALDIKLFRDLRRLWPLVLAVALVIAGGASTLLMSVGSYRSLDETRLAYYERYQFADVFASASRAPKTLVRQIAEIPGVAAVDARIATLALLDIPNFREPATGQFISLPEGEEPTLNQLYIRVGRLPEPGRPEEVVVNEGFAKAHAFSPGARLSALLNGRKRELTVVGLALSPEFIYPVGPGDIMPDDRRFGIVWMSEKALASAYDLEGAFSSVNLKLLYGASEPEVIKRLDTLLDPYGGRAAYGRKDQTSHAWLNHVFDMLKYLNWTLPPIFLAVGAFLVNLTLNRIVSLEREQIGLLKALGYGNFAIAAHYIKFVVVIVVIGTAIGSAAGTLLGLRITGLFGELFRFPFLVYSFSPDIYLLAGLLSSAAAIAGGVGALRTVVNLAPAVAMQPPAPARFRHFLPPKFAINQILSQPTMMLLRNIARHPFRSAFTMLGMALATAILIISLFTRDMMEQLVNVTFFLADRQDATVSFRENLPSDRVMGEMLRMPGVLAAEPYRAVPALIRNGNIERRLVISGRPRDADLSRIIAADLRPVVLPQSGLAISSMLAQILQVQVGDTVEIDLLEGQRRSVSLPVTALVEDYFGLRGMMDAQALSRLMREAPAVNSVYLSLDTSKLDQLYDAVKGLPAVSGMALQRESLTNFREFVALLITTMGSIYTVLAAVIAFGVVYSGARISLSERSRELASLRVLGFTRGEVFRILLFELGFLVVIAQPLGWVLGYGLAWVMIARLAGELMRAPLVLLDSTYVLASVVVLVSALLSALIVRERVNGLDLVAVLKTRD